MVGEVWFYSLLYWLFALVVVFPPDEMVAAGLTVEALLGSWLGSQLTGFIQYQIRRTAVTLMVHVLLLPGYILMLIRTEPSLMRWANTQIHPDTTAVVVILSLVPVIVTALVVTNWWRDNWQRHPLSKTLSLYSQGNVRPSAWVSVASDVNNEFRRIDKFSTKANSVCRVIATDSWLMKVTAYRVHLTHQRDAVLSLESSVNHQLSQNNSLDTQLLNIKVTSIREGIAPFYIRLSSLEYSELERKIVNPVVNARQVVVQQSLSDRFLEAFLEIVNLNPKVNIMDESVMCIGCMEVAANIKLQRQCGTTNNGSGNSCVACYCRPMWCVSCLSKWFAARQDQNHPESWLSSRAPCPTCRSPFCLLDVCIISDH
ncbi:E3 ubiquitin-protein ligase TM129-like [Homarus americanus]|uniref:Transmembrane protein 129-like n=1 Tax=Homarus americanus TaxID=6706 RepID=A0A8J5MVN6_HOMAM|nr:E3 ubiquitin-protein ligase TM129-like [Homarus americanus]XP_042229841.1 E3 ubiquitin-protein ligase TM129-like [Homarus americanus]XP_042229842.1 E3 ubiquitin-protein ligase TM129-like [Homarus americanus]XP_042229843.1 E3 ubiquitin-protein ligase TM129-like [Homarus americanus]KAG7164734.1 Transmembrane protein 129-like [Homarus americanus]